MSVNDSKFSTCLTNLGNSLESRYRRRGMISDLEYTIRLSREAVKLLPVDHPDFAASSNNLVVKLEARYDLLSELDDLEEAIQLSRQAIIVTPDDDTATVMQQMYKYNVAHFACHGISNPTNPSQSGLLLQTVSDKPMQDILTVRKMCENQHTLGGLAYLSACSAAENQAAKLVDKVIHVVSGFQAAGFRHVIGCLWPSEDDVCVEVARSFYSELFQKNTVDYPDRAVALAIHKAASNISRRPEYRRRPLYWALYVHYGA
ncbi:CHAT domain-containing protein [Aspergillus novoparasiticus]|uniref:CHAT domain-containing protein n=1 Tax=Aspergillus novoparasiticus TaxID=986946 RepID=A0A5N6EG48_9EURO|nr:CHAT domain-containing protein [Aspergillus novoparasiticus]